MRIRRSNSYYEVMEENKERERRKGDREAVIALIHSVVTDPIARMRLGLLKDVPVASE
jgi:hypothetical protein